MVRGITIAQQFEGHLLRVGTTAEVAAVEGPGMLIVVQYLCEAEEAAGHLLNLSIEVTERSTQLLWSGEAALDAIAVDGVVVEHGLELIQRVVDEPGVGQGGEPSFVRGQIGGHND